MKIRSLLVASVVGLIVSGPANAFFIDLGGETADGAGFNYIYFNNSNSNAVVNVEFDFVYETGDNASWGSEVIVEIGHLPTGTYGHVGSANNPICSGFGVDCEFDLMWDDTSGTFYGSGSFAFPSAIADGSGDWQIIIADSFDDSGIDGTFLEGSYIQVNQVAVPAPAPLALLGIGLAGMGLLRSRRKKA